MLTNTLDNKRIAVAVSGGVDSVALLHYLVRARGEHSYVLSVVNVEHGIRGDNSVCDSDFVKNLAIEYDLPFYGFRVDAPAYARERGLSVEHAARELRYACFDSLVSSGVVEYIATAHHRDDCVETIMLRIMRGTGVSGLAGIREQSGYIVRPLLSLSRAEICTYAAERGLKHVNDESNSDEDYARNYIRLSVLPPLRERWNGLDEAIVGLSAAAAETDEMTRTLASRAVYLGEYLFGCTPVRLSDTPVANKLYFALSGARAYCTVVQVKPKECEFVTVLKKAYQLAFRALGVYVDVEQRHLDLLTDFSSSRNGRKLDMPYGVIAYIEGECVVLERREDEDAALCIPVSELPREGIATPYGEVRLIRRTAFDMVYFDNAKLPTDAVLRYRRTGDKCALFNGTHRSLGDYFTDKGIPVRVRSRIPVIAVGNEVLVVSGMSISATLAVDANTKKKDITTLYFKPNTDTEDTNV